MTDKQLLEQALEALDSLQRMASTFADELHDKHPDVIQARVAVTAIKARLAQPEQEPVAWGFQNSAITGSNRWMMLREEVPSNDQYGGALWIPLYTHPTQRTWVGLTDEEMLECNMEGDLMIDRETAKRNVEAKLKEKNT